MNRFIYFFFISAVILCLNSCGYSKIKKNEQDVLNTWAVVETNLHRRADLIPDLIEFVNNYAPEESGFLKNIIKARAETALIQFTAKDLSDQVVMKAFTGVQNNLSHLLSKLEYIVERHPDLQANQNYIEVINRIEETENRMAVSCNQYNKAVEVFNQSIQKFPNNIANNLFLHITKKEQLRLQQASK